MKCKHCGHEVTAYKEIKQVMANEGFDRNYLKEQINATVKAAVDAAVGAKLTEYIPAIVRERVAFNLYSRDVRDAITQGIGEAMEGFFDVRIRQKGARGDE